jgi:hypothetical protein
MRATYGTNSSPDSIKTTAEADTSSIKTGSVASQTQMRPRMAWAGSPTSAEKELKRHDIYRDVSN